MRRILLATVTGLLILLGAAAPATAATANVMTAGECHIDDPDWQVSWTSEDAVTLRECGGEGGWSTDGQLPVTGWTAGAAAGTALILVGLGTGLFAISRRRRMTFTS